MKKDQSHISFSVSKKDFKDFFDGKMIESQKESFLHEVEKDEFLKEAFKGYMSNPDAINDIEDIENSIKTKVTKINFSTRLKIFSSFTAIILIVIISIYFINQNVNSKKINLSANSALIDTHHVNIINREIEQASLIPASKQITSLKAAKEQKQVNIFEKDMPIEMVKKLRAISVNNNADNVNDNLPIFEHYTYMPVEYMYELKVVDYTKTNRTKIKKDIYDGGSLPPKYENRQNPIDTTLTNDASTVPYNEFLNDAMGKFSSNNFKEALRDFIIILQQYPDDQNAHFYGGLCYYNIGLYENAITFFDEILESNVATYTQEALWYKALSLYNNGHVKEAKILLNKIIDTKGFYTNQANEKMQEIK